MAAMLSVQIALEGGKEIEKQLENIGKAGQKAFTDIAKAAGEAGGFDKLDPGVIEKKLAGAKLAAEELEKVKKALSDTAKLEKLAMVVASVEGAFIKLGISVRALLVALGPLGVIAVLVSGLVALANSALQAAAAISKIDAQAIKLGLTIEQFSKLREAFGRAGISADAFSAGLERLKSEIDRLNLERVSQAVTKAQANMALGWGPGEEHLRTLRTLAAGIGPAADAARVGLQQLGQPFDDRVTPLFESMVQWAGNATKAIPQIANELARLGSEGERARFVTMALQRIASEAPNAATALQSVVSAAQQMPDTIQRNNAILGILGDKLGTEVVQALRTGGIAIDELIAKSQGLTQSQANTANSVEQSISKMAAAWDRFSHSNFGQEQLVAAMNAAAAGIDKVNAATQAGATLISNQAQAWGGVSSGIQGASGNVDQLNTKLEQALSTIQKMNAAGGGGGGEPRLAGGGLMGGRGTGTSDSNLAWLSRGEHVMPARAVRQPGVLSLLEALRRSGGNLSGVLDRLGSFALGGLVGPAAIPAFAGGGVNGMSHVTIAFPGLPPIGGLRAPGSVVDELRKAAGLAQVRSGGRKPSRYS